MPCETFHATAVSPIYKYHSEIRQPWHAGGRISSSDVCSHLVGAFFCCNAYTCFLQEGFWRRQGVPREGNEGCALAEAGCNHYHAVLVRAPRWTAFSLNQQNNVVCCSMKMSNETPHVCKFCCRRQVFITLPLNIIFLRPKKEREGDHPGGDNTSKYFCTYILCLLINTCLSSPTAQ